jgi:probable phosphoglycerate mutase
MRISEFLTAVLVFSTIVLAGCSQRLDDTDSVSAMGSESERKPVVVFLVRHAEKADLSEDPELSTTGDQRALVLARTLRGAKIDHIHSSDFIRTASTAAPTANEFGLEVQLYDPRDLPGLVEKLRSAGGRHLVVGHSNTTPAMVELLGGDASPPINEKGEFDRLYNVTIGPDGTTTSVMLRYGEPFESE